MRVLIALPSPVFECNRVAFGGVQATTIWARRERRSLTNGYGRPRHRAGSSCSRQQVHASLCGFVFGDFTPLLACVMMHNATTPANAYKVTRSVVNRVHLPYRLSFGWHSL